MLNHSTGGDHPIKAVRCRLVKAVDTKQGSVEQLTGKHLIRAPEH